MAELNEVLDENFNVIGTKSRDEIKKENLLHKASLVIVKNSKGEYFVAQRKATKSIYPLKWNIGAGGAVRAGESFEEAASREVKEEIGINAVVKELFEFTWYSDVVSYFAKIFLAEYNGEINVDLEECEQGKWVNEEEMNKMIEKKELTLDTIEYFLKYKELFK